MIKKINYLLIPACMTLSVAMAEPSPLGAVLLSPNEMDQVTGGLGAAVIVNAAASGSVYATTHTNAGALTAVSRPDNPALGGYVEVAGGQAYATAVGPGATTYTNVSPSTSTQGSPGTYTTQVAASSPGMSVNIIYTTNALFNPF